MLGLVPTFVQTACAFAVACDEPGRAKESNTNHGLLNRTENGVPFLIQHFEADDIARLHESR